MEIYEALNTHLLAQSGLTALIGDRIYPDEAPEGTDLPYVVYRTISNSIDSIYGGQQTLERPNYEWIIYAETKLGASAIGRQVKAAFYKRETEITGLVVQYIRLINDIPSSAVITEGVKAYTLNLEFEVNFENT